MWCCSRKMSVGALAVLMALLPAPAMARQDEAMLATARDELAAAYDELAMLDRSVPRDTFDPAAIVETVGRDPAALLGWVRDNTTLLPYQGALKGPVGVLLDRGGSSCDRALLLADLLRRTGHRVRLAHATLDTSTAQSLLSQSGSAAGRIGDVSGEPNAALLDRINDHATRLREAIELRPDAAAEQAKILAATQDHWWVQIDDNGTWRDLDPSGLTPPTPEATFDYDAGDGRIPLPDKFVHTIDVRVIIEAWEDGGLGDRRVVEATVRPGEMVGGKLILRHHPLGQQADAQAEFTQRMLSQREWVPVLEIDGRLLGQRSFSDAGEINDRPNLDPAAVVGQQVGGMFGDLGGGMSGGSDEPAEPTSVLTAEWIEFTLRSPGQPERIVRRPVFDLIGPSARAAGVTQRPTIGDAQRLDRALAIGGLVESLPQVATYTKPFVRHLAFRTVLNERPTWSALLDEETTDETRTSLLGRLDRGSPLPWLALARTTLSPARGSVYLDSPNLLDYHVRVVAEDGGAFAVRRTIDLAVNDVAAVPGVQDPALSCLAQGVADTAAEDFVLQSDEGQDLAEARWSDNTMPLLDANASTGGEVVTLVPGESATIAGDAGALVSADLAAGYAVVAPAAPVELDGRPRLGWWRINPVTGEAVGVMDTGYHQGQTEYIEDTYIADTHLGNTYVSYGGKGPGRGLFWKRHPRAVARDLGYDPNDFSIIEKILDIQYRMLANGSWI